MIVVDIETMPNPEMVKFLPEVKIDSRLKDEAKIKANIKEKKKIQIEKMALDPLYGKIACIGFYGDDKKEVIVEDEKAMIEKLFKFTENDVIFTWNGKKFDFDFIIKRGTILGNCTLLDLPIYTDKYKSNGVHIDLMEEWAGYNKYAKLDDVSHVFLNRKKIKFDVSIIPELLKTPEGIQVLKEYCLEDCKLVYDLAKKLGY